MKIKYKCVSNIDFIGMRSDYLTVGSVYEFDMEGVDCGTAYGKNGEEVYEFFPNPTHGKWEKVD